MHFGFMPEKEIIEGVFILGRTHEGYHNEGIQSYMKDITMKEYSRICAVWT